MSSTEKTPTDSLPGSHLSGPLSPPTTPPRRKKNEYKNKASDEFDRQSCSQKREHDALPSPPASPLSNISKPSNEDKALSELKELKSKLGLGTGLGTPKCGSDTKKTGAPCRIKRGSNEAEIDTQIESVIKHSKISASLLYKELYKLAQLVHCGYHIYDAQLCLRVKAWWPNFSDLKESVKEQISMILQYYQNTCIGSKKDGSPCGWKIGGRRVTKRKNKIGVFLKPNEYLVDERVDQFLQGWRDYTFCRHHREKTQATEKVESWKNQIQEILIKANLESYSTAELAPPSLRESQMPSCNGEFERSSFEIEKDETSDSYELSFKNVYEVLNTPIEGKDQKKGYVYVFKDEANPEFVKIGFTTKEPEVRLQEWKDDCNRNFMALYPHPSTRMKVSNVHRVEELCHAELNHRNIKIYCRICSKPHVEWFKVTPDEAIAVIEKWSKWMSNDKPYTESGTLKERVELYEIDRFIKRLSTN